MFMAAVVLNAAVLCVATYLRADKTERLAFVYGSSTVLILSLAWGLGLRYGTLGVVGGYLIVITLYTGPLAVRRFLSVRRTRITEAYPAELPKVST
jgi:hypothetical protein